MPAGGIARSLQIHADMCLARALPAAKIPASSCKSYFLTAPKWIGTDLYVLSGSSATITEFDAGGNTVRSLGGIGSNPQIPE